MSKVLLELRNYAETELIEYNRQLRDASTFSLKNSFDQIYPTIWITRRKDSAAIL